MKVEKLCSLLELHVSEDQLAGFEALRQSQFAGFIDFVDYKPALGREQQQIILVNYGLLDVLQIARELALVQSTLRQ